MGSKFARNSVVALCALTVSVGEAMASSKGAAGFTKATQEVSSYQTPVSNLMKAIAAVIVLVGAFNVYFKMQNGDQDVKKTIMLTIGGFNVFTSIKMITGGKPMHQTETVLTWMYYKAFNTGSFGYAAALSFVVAVTLIFLAVLQFRAMKQKDAANS